MAKVITLKDGTRAVITNDNDFSELVYKHMGAEAEDYITDRVQELETAADKQAQIIDSDFTSYEMSLESNARCFLDILEMVADVETLLQASRTNKQKALELVRGIRAEINTQI